VYFAAQLDPRKINIQGPGGAAIGGQFAIGVATASRLRGPWRTRILHYRGQFDAGGGPQEWGPGGGTIDPSIVRNTATGGLYLFWTTQPDEIWAGQLSADGLTLEPGITEAIAAEPGWDCDPLSICIVEGPEPFYHDGRLYVFYSGASTWDSSYGVGLATADDPLGAPFTQLPIPLLHSGNGFIGPGHCSHPVTGPDGSQYILYHAQLRPSRVAGNRYLMLDRVTWNGELPLIGNGVPPRSG
jgi:hypothetical protein